MAVLNRGRRNLKMCCVIVAIVVIIGIIPTLWNVSVMTVDRQSGSVYPKILLDSAFFDGSSCQPDYQQQTVVITLQELNALTQQESNAFARIQSQVEPYSNITEVGYLCMGEVDGCLTATGLAVTVGEPPVCFASEVMAKFAQNSPFIHMTIVGYVVSVQLSLNNQLPMNVTNVRGTAENHQAATSFHEIHCAPQCTFNVNLTFPRLGSSASSTTITVYIDTEDPIGWGVPPVWFEILRFPTTYQASVSIAGLR